MLQGRITCIRRRISMFGSQISTVTYPKPPLWSSGQQDDKQVISLGVWAPRLHIRITSPLRGSNNVTLLE